MFLLICHRTLGLMNLRSPGKKMSKLGSNVFVEMVKVDLKDSDFLNLHLIFYKYFFSFLSLKLHSKFYLNIYQVLFDYIKTFH